MIQKVSAGKSIAYNVFIREAGRWLTAVCINGPQSWFFGQLEGAEVVGLFVGRVTVASGLLEVVGGGLVSEEDGVVVSSPPSSSVVVLWGEAGSTVVPEQVEQVGHGGHVCPFGGSNAVVS